MAMALTSECVDDVKRILKQYLNQVVYIDDIFTLSLAGTKDNKSTKEATATLPVRRPITKKLKTEDISDYNYSIPSQKEEEEKSHLEKLIELIQHEHKDIQLFPIKYLGKESIETVINGINTSHLTIIDWNLEESCTAANILEKVIKNTEQMRLFVVYTSKKEEAEKNFKLIFNDMAFKDCKSSQTNKEYKFCIYNSSSIIMLCDKSTFNINEIIDEFSNILIDEFGFFPVVFFDTIIKLSGKTGKLLKKFAHPFESLLILQMYTSDFKFDDLPNVFTDLITNHISDELEVDSNIVHMIYEAKIKKINSLASLENSIIKNKIKEAIHTIIINYKGNKMYLNTLMNVDIEKFKRALSEFDSVPSNWSDSINKFVSALHKDLLSKIVIEKSREYTYIHQMKENDEKNNILKQLNEKLSKDHEKNLLEWLKNVFPTFLTVFCDSSIPCSVNNLISTLKLIKYNDIDLNNILNNKIIKKEIINPETGEKELDKKITAKNLKNMFFAGDILIDSEGRYLLCITPPCDAFRPEKVNFKLNYIYGKVIEKNIPLSETIRFLKSSEHITIIPDYISNKLIGIKWQYFRNKLFDLEYEDNVKDLQKYKRPYRLAPDYAQQIINKYAAYYTRVGVEEIFIKQTPQIGNIFLDN